MFDTIYESLHPYFYKCKLVATPAVTTVEADAYETLAKYDATTGNYAAITAEAKVFLNGRIFQCVLTGSCNTVKPLDDSITWRLTKEKGTLKAAAAITISVTKPALATSASDPSYCLTDSFKTYSTTATDDWALQTPATASVPAANSLLYVKGRTICSTDPEMKRRLAAGKPIYKPIGAGALTNAPYNMAIYKQSVSPNLVSLATIGKDPLMRKQHIETAFASFPLFCGDAPGTAPTAE